MLGALRNDALDGSGDGFRLRLSLPWIRSLPLWSLVDLEVAIDGRIETNLRVDLGGREIAPSSLADELGWWFVQDRLVVRGDRALTHGQHDVDINFGLLVPYLQAGPEGPLRLPFHFTQTLPLVDHVALPNVAHDVA